MSKLSCAGSTERLVPSPRGRAHILTHPRTGPARARGDGYLTEYLSLLKRRYVVYIQFHISIFIAASRSSSFQSEQSFKTLFCGHILKKLIVDFTVTRAGLRGVMVLSNP